MGLAYKLTHLPLFFIFPCHHNTLNMLTLEERGFSPSHSNTINEPNLEERGDRWFLRQIKVSLPLSLSIQSVTILRNFYEEMRFKSAYPMNFKRWCVCLSCPFPCHSSAAFLYTRVEIHCFLIFLLHCCSVSNTFPSPSQVCQGLLMWPSFGIPGHSPSMEYCFICRAKKLMWYRQVTFLLYFLISLFMTSSSLKKLCVHFLLIFFEGLE